MFKHCIALAGLLLCAATASAQVYKWVDEDGVVHYSDQPVPGAEVVFIEQNTVRTRSPRATVRPLPGADAAPDSAPAATFAYETISFASPVAEQTLWNIGGTLNVALNLSPGLRLNDRVRLYFDGEPVQNNVVGTSTQLEEVWRGSHNLQAEVVDENGNLMIRSEPIRFYVQQTSVLN